MEKHQFKPFDKVLVRDHDEEHWRTDLFSHRYVRENTMWYSCIGNSWKQCIPYNENTKNLVGTTNAYKQPKPKTYWVEWMSKDGAHRVEYTDEEFENFIKIAVIHNKDIQNFNVRKICG